MGKGSADLTGGERRLVVQAKRRVWFYEGAGRLVSELVAGETRLNDVRPGAGCFESGGKGLDGCDTFDLHFDVPVFRAWAPVAPPYQLFVKTLTGKTLTIDTQEGHTVAILKELVRDKEGIPPEEQRLVWNGKQLEDERTLRGYQVSKGQTMHVVLRLRGGGDTLGPHAFADLSRPLEERKLVYDGPRWRALGRGLAFDGVCENIACEAFSQHVVVNIGYGEFDFQHSMPKARCPMCNVAVANLSTCYFSDCKWHYVAMDENGIVTASKEEKVQVQGGYATPSNVAVTNRKAYKRLKITAQWIYDDEPHIRENDGCAICSEDLGKSPTVQSCGHAFHDHCIHAWHTRAPSPTCPLCRRISRTSLS